MKRHTNIRIQQIIIFLFMFGIIPQIINSQPDPPGGPQYGSMQYTTIYIPKGENVEGILFTDVDRWVTYYEEYGAWLVDLYDWDATRVGAATHQYNCHGYAWHVSEGGNNVLINYLDQYGNQNLSKYWTGLQSYVTPGSTAIGRKIRYTNDDHSAITTSNSSYAKSKWGKLPLYEHLKSDCPYTSTGLSYYKLNPGDLTGSTSILCNNVQRTFSTDITDMDGATLTWTPGSYITYVSGAGTSDYTVKGSGNGESYVDFQITTLTGFTWSDSKSFWAGKPVVNSINGPTQGYTYTQYDFWTSPSRNPLSESEYTWMVNPESYGFNYQYYDWVTITFYAPDYYQVMARATNTCGASNWKNKIVMISGGYKFSASPNPTSEEVKIMVTKEDTEALTMETEVPEFDVRIYDMNGNMYYTGKKSGLYFTLPVSNLKNGSYLISISNGEKKKSIPLIVKH